jgi:FAD/FMN-containing dehydrogenase
MNAIKELDLANRTVTVGTGINMLKLNERLAPHGLIYPDNPASYPCSLVGGRIGTSGWSLIGARYGHTRDLVLSFDHVLPTGEVMHVGDGVGHKISKSSSGYQLKHLFMGHQGTLGIATEATLKLFPKPEAELSPFWAFDNYDDAYACVGALARAGVLRSVRGPRGGFQLAGPPARLTLARVVSPFDEVGERHCLLGRAQCGDRNACAAHGRWVSISDSLQAFFRNTTIADLMDDATAGARLSRI